MLTKLEVHGFKNLLDFSVEFGPFTCLAGPNAVGKSNIFDAIRFLSLLADYSLMEAALRVRDSDPETSDPLDIFWRSGSSRLGSMKLAAEMIVPPSVEDDFGRPAEASSTFLRYEIELGYELTNAGAVDRLVLFHELLDYFPQKDAASKLAFPHSAGDFRRHVVHNRRRGKEYISTSSGPVKDRAIHVHQDGGSSGQPQKSPAWRAPKTIVATTNTSAQPTILAARREMQRWRILALEPSAMRGADRFHTPPEVTESGDHLPATLHRLETQSEPGTVNSRIANRLAEIVPVDEVRVHEDDVRQLLTLEVVERSGVVLPARSLSDGTLRFLTLCILERDPEAVGLLCMEEPENGIHPSRMDEMVTLLRDLAVDTSEAPGPDNPMRQVIVATHSPWFVQLQRRGDLLAAERVRVRAPTNGKAVNTVRCTPLYDTWRAPPAGGVGKASIISYLVGPSRGQLSLVDELPDAELSAE